MKDAYEVFEKVLTVLQLPLTGWTVAAFALAFVLRKRLTKGIELGLNALGMAVGGAWFYRRFVPQYRRLIRERHETMKLVGLRTESERRPRIAEAYIPIKLHRLQETIATDVTIEAVADTSKCSVILGDPGAGKSTLLDYLVLRFTEASATSLWSRVYGVLFARRNTAARLPIYVPLRRCEDRNLTLLDDILDPDTTILSAPIRESMPKGFIKRSLSRGDALLLLDGLDEVVSDEAYRSAARKINDFLQLFPSSRVVLSCRKAGWRGGLQPPPDIFHVLPLDFQQQYDFVHRWYAAILQYAAHGTGADRSELRRRARREADQLLSLVRTKERLRELASNPLILSLICLVHRQKKNLPRGRADLYAECVDILLFHWDQIDKDLDQDSPTTEQKKELLRRIAHRMHSSGLREIGRSELKALVLEVYPGIADDDSTPRLIRQIEVRSGLMAERSIDRLAFSHLTFQEFFVVDYLRDRLGFQISQMDLTEQRWREPALLLCGLGRLPMPLIAQIFAQDPLLALHAIPEADPAYLDVSISLDLILEIIRRIRAHQIPFDEAAAGIIGLMSIEGNPFGETILSFVYDSLTRDHAQGFSTIIETLSKSQTRATARVLLSLLRQQELRDRAPLLIAGLARIGDAAVYEALEAASHSQLAEEHIFDLLIGSTSQAATEALWTRYELTPPNGREADWAIAWALRLSDVEADKIVRSQRSRSAPVNNRLVWPYRPDDATALAAIVQRCVAILRQLYSTQVDLVRDIARVSDFALYIQIPLLLTVPPIPIDPYNDMPEVMSDILRGWGAPVPGPRHEQLDNVRDRVASALHIHSRWPILAHGFLPVNPTRRYMPTSRLRTLGVVFDEHLWRTLRGFLTQKRSTVRNVVKRAGWTLGLAIEGAMMLTCALGIRALLPFDGSYLGLWDSLPVWAKIVSPLLFSGIVVGMSLAMNDGFVDSDLFFLCGFLGVTGILVIAAPLVLLLAPLILYGPRVVEELLSGEPVRWMWPLSLTGVSLITGALAAIVLHHMMGTVSWAAVFTVVIVALLGMWLQARSSAFERNGLADWLATHPRGDEVLREFRFGSSESPRA